MKPDGSLAEYTAKRNFKKTAEPAGRVARGSGFSFVVQKHAATRLHYDFRLELDGVLKSWAVTKGPSLDPRQKRLAVRTEDHPLDYGTFEGTIPKGEYGGGTVMLWDRGTWEPLHDPRAGLEEGMLHFLLDGERLKGGWALIRMPPRGRETRENWLLIKERDDHADDADPLLETNTTSVTTGRTMDAIANGGSAVWHSNREPRSAPAAAPPTSSRVRKSAPRLGLPDFRAPQLASLTERAPDGSEWLHEMKYDGYRCLVAADGPDVRCYSRSGLDWTAKFAPVAEAIRSLGLSGTLIDGEVVAFAPDGRTDFSTLQNALKEGGALNYFAFDLLQDAGRDITREPLTERKARLQERLAGLPEGSILHYSEHIRGEGTAVLANICAAGHEGVVSKLADSVYRGERTKSWLKIKCTHRQEFVIGGWTASDRRAGFRSLLVGTWQGGQLVYAGRVGTGFDADDLESLGGTLESLKADVSPFASVPRDVRKSHWVRPELVAEIGFTEFTADGILRHPSFLGLREDKPAAEVKIERPASKGAEGMGEGDHIVCAGVQVTNPGKILFPGQAVSKIDLIDYYEAVFDLMRPHIAERPLSLVRCPQGRGRKCFFQKHDSGGFPGELKRVDIVENSGAEVQYFYLTDLPGIVSGVQMGVLEWHVWGSRRRQVEKPDRMVFDLDPDEGLDFNDVRRAAFDLRERLAALGLETFPMLSGGKGFHVVAPLLPRAEWTDVKAFCRAFAVRLGDEDPARYVAVMTKARRKGRIFVDYLRNERGATAIAPYSTRARDGAPVAAPITWDEARSVKAANVFDVTTMPKRTREVGDPWPSYFDVKQALTKAIMKKVGMA